jgi:hypothetical protein
MGDYYQAFTEQEARDLGTTLEGARRWAKIGKQSD